MTFLIGGAAVEAPVQPDGLSRDEQDRAAVWLEKCCLALWRYDRAGKLLRQRELWVQRNAGHPLWAERKQQVFEDLWDWQHAWEAFHAATERLDGVLHRWPEEQQRMWLWGQGFSGRSVKVPPFPQVIENTNWFLCAMYLRGDAPF